MPHDLLRSLQDILNACQKIERFTQSKTFEEYRLDDLLRDGVERNFITIGEAITRAKAISPVIGIRIIHSQTIVAFRNRLTHSYDVTDDEIVWKSAREDLPLLKETVLNLIVELKEAGGPS